MTLELIKVLREKTHLGLNDCKKALTEASGDLDKAIEILQKKGLKKVDDLILPLEGEVRATKNGYLFELNCQTDFGARSETFQNLLHEIVEKLETEPTKIVVKYGFDQLDFSNEFKNSILQASKILGEKIVLRRIKALNKRNRDHIIHYNHNGKVAVAVLFATPDALLLNGPSSTKKEFMENVALQIAAMKPICVSREEIATQELGENSSPCLLNIMKALFLEEVANKPEASRAKIVEGKLNKYCSEVVLLEQESIVEPKKTIKQQIEQFSPILKIVEFIRFGLGEEI